MALLDSGACRSCVSKEFINKFKIDVIKLEGNNVKFLTAANGQALKIEGQAGVLVKLNGLTMTHTFYVVLSLSNPVILGVDWLTLNQAKLDFQHNLVSLHDGLVIANFNQIAGDRSNTLLTENYCIIPPRTEQIFNVRSSTTRFVGRLLMIEPLVYHDRTRYLLARYMRKKSR